jgi:hypothetical protein
MHSVLWDVVQALNIVMDSDDDSFKVARAKSPDSRQHPWKTLRMRPYSRMLTARASEHVCKMAAVVLACGKRHISIIRVLSRFPVADDYNENTKR